MFSVVLELNLKYVLILRTLSFRGLPYVSLQISESVPGTLQSSVVIIRSAKLRW